jgi:hypothetical protein
MGQKKEIKELLESILGAPVHFTSDKVDEETRIKNEFVRIISLFEEAWQRQHKLFDQFKIDIASIDDIYFQVIESLVHFCFEPVAAEAILFYVYTRFESSKEVVPFLDDEGIEHTFNTKEELWEYLVDLKVKIDKDAKGKTPK